MKRRPAPSTTAAKPLRGRPPVHQEPWSKVSVVLFDRQIAHLADYGRARLTTRRRHLSRAEVIRALLDALIESGMDLTRITSEADLRARLTRQLSGQSR